MPSASASFMSLCSVAAMYSTASSCTHAAPHARRQTVHRNARIQVRVPAAHTCRAHQQACSARASAAAPGTARVPRGGHGRGAQERACRGTAAPGVQGGRRPDSAAGAAQARARAAGRAPAAGSSARACSRWCPGTARPRGGRRPGARRPACAHGSGSRRRARSAARPAARTAAAPRRGSGWRPPASPPPARTGLAHAGQVRSRLE